jgi:hypothetical protein
VTHWRWAALNSRFWADALVAASRSGARRQ